MGLQYDTPVQYIKGVGPKLGQVLARRSIYTVGDLLEWYPRSYEDRRAARSIDSLQPGETVSLTAEVFKVRSMNLGRSRRKMYEIILRDSTGRIGCKYFRVPYRGYFERFEPFQKVRVIGKVTHYRGQVEFHHPDVHPVQEGGADEDMIVPLYTETEGLNPAKLRKIISQVLSELKNPSVKNDDKVVVPEYLPQWMLERYKLLEKSKALVDIHLPPKDSGSEFVEYKSLAQKRIIFEEFFWLELLLAAKKSGLARESAPKMKLLNNLINKFKENLEFQLTRAQEQALEEVIKDLTRPHPMHRLVQGDVGSGKTMVALLSAVFAAENGYQSALMVPTEILAEQHYKNAMKRLQPLGLKVGFLTGSMGSKQKNIINDQLLNGEIDVVIGTHALIQDNVFFKKLGLVIIDEQHRFGVEQRNKLKAKGESPHFLVMTATPIPRSLAMTVYGDLDVSIIDELPAGRQPIVTRKTFESKRSKVMGFMRDQIMKGRQAYIVYPLVEESEKIDLKNALEEFEKLKKQFKDVRFGLLHGKMKPQEKDAIMRSFRDHELDVLVSTTVIEVGVDVPNANIMIVEHAERFGLSQLHQLRGRVGRGAHKSYCVLLLSYAVSEESMARAEIMESTSDGFKIAESDLELRGPGEFLGTRQSGLPGFKMANLVRDLPILKMAREAAFELVERDPQFQREDHIDVKIQLDKQRDQLIG